MGWNEWPRWLKIGVILLIIILSFLLLNQFGFSFVGITKVKVVDIITEQPIENISVQQGLLGVISQFPAGSSGFDIRFIKKYTDKSGTVAFPPLLYFKPSILRSFHFEYDSVNELELDLTRSSEEYYSGYSEFHSYSWTFPFKYIELRIMPKVDDISDCRNNQECISINSNDLALLKKDISFCKNASNKFECYTTFALFTNNSELCNQISDKYKLGECKSYMSRRDSLITIDEAKEFCSRIFWGNNRAIRACETLSNK